MDIDSIVTSACFTIYNMLYFLEIKDIYRDIMALTFKEKQILPDYIDEQVKSGYGIIFDFKIQNNTTLKKQISKESYSAANQYIKKNADKTWWHMKVGKQPMPNSIKKQK